jgi:glycosyltransferase involved in cell wall biosynthesis
MPASDKKILSVVVIGLNEAKHLQACLQAVIDTAQVQWELEIIYVDSGSTDSSVSIANGFKGVQVLHLKDKSPSAAKARNLGLSASTGKFVQLIDGDSIVQNGWLETAANRLEAEQSIACVFGWCVEMFPTQSIYTQVCSFDWHTPPGDSRYCGGNSMWRLSVLKALNYFDDALRFGEEPDLCFRTRKQGHRIVCIDQPMVMHDLNMLHFKQYWQRAKNSGVAYAAVSYRYRKNEEKLWLLETTRNFLEPALWIAIFALFTFIFSWKIGIGILITLWVVRAVRIAVSVRSRSKNASESLLYGLHCQLYRIPAAIGQLSWFFNANNRRQTGL